MPIFNSALPSGFLRNPVHFCAFGFGSGCMAKAPGTWGTLMAVVPYFFLTALPDWLYLVFLVLSFVVGIWLCELTSRALGVHDHGGIVWDEFVGFWLTMAFAPAGAIWVVYGFALFRLFDIWKPQPIRWADSKVHGGLGIMLDDVLAGCYALAVLQLTAWYFA